MARRTTPGAGAAVELEAAADHLDPFLHGHQAEVALAEEAGPGHRLEAAAEAPTTTFRTAPGPAGSRW